MFFVFLNILFPFVWIIQIEVPEWTLNRFASVYPRVVEIEFGNEILLEYLSLAFWSQTHIYISPSYLFKMVWRDMYFQKAFSENFKINWASNVETYYLTLMENELTSLSSVSRRKIAWITMLSTRLTLNFTFALL